MSAFVARRGVRRLLSSRVFLHPGEVDEHARFVPDHPGVVAGWDDGVAVRACAATCFPSGARRRTPLAFPTKTTRHPAQIPQEVAGGSRLGPGNSRKTTGEEGLLATEIPAYSRSAPKTQDRPVMPEVAGSSPVAPVKTLQTRKFCRPVQAQRPPASIDPAHIPPGNPRTKPGVAGNSRTPGLANRPEIASPPNSKEAGSQELRSPRLNSWLPSRAPSPSMGECSPRIVAPEAAATIWRLRRWDLIPARLAQQIGTRARAEIKALLGARSCSSEIFLEQHVCAR